MSERDEGFSAFLQEWNEANIGSLGNQTDPSDHQYYYKRRAEQLQEDATAKGYSVEIRRLGLDHKGGLREYIEGVYEQKESRRRYGF